MNIERLGSGLDFSRLARLSKEGSWIIVGQLLAATGSLVGIRVLTELLDPSVYGELALGMSLATLVNQTLFGPLASGTSRFFAPASEREDVGGYLAAVTHFVALATLSVAFYGVVAVLGLLTWRRSDLIGLATVALIFATLSGYNSIVSSIQTAARQRSVAALHQGMDPWLRYLAAAGLIYLVGAGSSIVMLAYSSATLVVLSSQTVFLLRVPRNKARDGQSVADWKNQIWEMSWPVATFGVFTWVYLASDRWALGVFRSKEEVGLYAVLFQLGNYPITLATGLVTQFLGPILYQRAGDGTDKDRNASVARLGRRLTGMVFAATLVGFFVTLAFHQQVFHLFVAKEYNTVSHHLPWVVLAAGLFASGQTIAMNMMSQMNARGMVAPKIATALLGTALNVVGAHWFGTVGVVAAGVIFAASYFCWMNALQGRP